MIKKGNVMIDVLVQMWGPVEGTFSYSWITIGRISGPESIDVDALMPEVSKIFGRNEYKPHADIARLVILKDGTVEMKIMINNILRKEVK